MVGRILPGQVAGSSTLVPPQKGIWGCSSRLYWVAGKPVRVERCTYIAWAAPALLAMYVVCVGWLCNWCIRMLMLLIVRDWGLIRGSEGCDFVPTCMCSDRPLKLS